MPAKLATVVLIFDLIVNALSKHNIIVCNNRFWLNRFTGTIALLILAVNIRTVNISWHNIEILCKASCVITYTSESSRRCTYVYVVLISNNIVLVLSELVIVVAVLKRIAIKRLFRAVIRLIAFIPTAIHILCQLNGFIVLRRIKTDFLSASGNLLLCLSSKAYHCTLQCKAHCHCRRKRPLK